MIDPGQHIAELSVMFKVRNDDAGCECRAAQCALQRLVARKQKRRFDSDVDVARDGMSVIMSSPDSTEVDPAT